MGCCRSCLKETAKSFCPRCRKLLFNNAPVGHILPFARPEFDEFRMEGNNRISISGVQTKYSLVLENNVLKLTPLKGEYIIKPVPVATLQAAAAVPANEHITMQIAKQVFKLNTAECCLMEFTDGQPAYVVKRFDVLPDGRKLLQEDFAQIAGRTEENRGRNYKYDFSYEEIAELIKKFVPAYKIEIERFFSVIIFSYLFCNGDAHLKNFSLYRNETFGDYTLTPFYDLLNTSFHVPGESDMALDLFKDGYQTEAYKYGNKYTRPDFIEFGVKIGIAENRILKILNHFTSKISSAQKLLNKSFLSDELKHIYLNSLSERVKRVGE